MKKIKKISVSLFLVAILVIRASINALAMSDEGSATYGEKDGGWGYTFEYCYYYHGTKSHWSVAMLDGHSSGKQYANAGKTSIANSPSLWGYSSVFRDYDIN